MLCLHVYMCTTQLPSTLRGQKRALDSLRLDLQMVISSQVLLGSEPGSSAGSISTLKCWVIFPDPILSFSVCNRDHTYAASTLQTEPSPQPQRCVHTHTHAHKYTHIHTSTHTHPHTLKNLESSRYFCAISCGNHSCASSECREGRLHLHTLAVKVNTPFSLVFGNAHKFHK